MLNDTMSTEWNNPLPQCDSPSTSANISVGGTSTQQIASSDDNPQVAQSNQPLPQYHSFNPSKPMHREDHCHSLESSNKKTTPILSLPPKTGEEPSNPHSTETCSDSAVIPTDSSLKSPNRMPKTSTQKSHEDFATILTIINAKRARRI